MTREGPETVVGAGFALRAQSDVGFLDVAEVEYAAGFEMGEHRHPRAYLTAVLDGGFSERTPATVRSCGAGSVVFRPAGEPHATRVEARGARCLRVRFASAGPEPAGAPAPESSVDVPAGTLGWLAGRLHLELRARSRTGTETAARALMAEVARLTTPLVRQPPAWLQQVVQRIRAEFHRPLTLAALAAPAGVHPAHLVRAFRRWHGATVAAYVRRLRLEHAMCELRASRRSLAAVAHAAGFADQSHLTRLLKAATGTTPAAFRRRTAR